MSANTSLLQMGDPAPFGTENPVAASPILFVSDHAGRAIPRALGTLGVDSAAMSRHIAYDIGIYGVTTRLARALDATYVFQPYSRLVIDCNRQPGVAQSIMDVSDGTPVPGNAGLSESAIHAREGEILEPYHGEIRRVLAERARRGQPTVLFAMHSCTDKLNSEAASRPWHIGILADQDWRIGDPLIALLEAETSFCVGRNQPYTVDLESDYTIPLHAVALNIPYVEIEIRQDLIADEAGQQAWADLLSDIFPRAVRQAQVLAA